MKLLAHIFLLLTLTSCNKDDLPGLPPITTTGENTFGCYVDGVLITPRDGHGGLYRWRKEGMLLFTRGIEKETSNTLKVCDCKSDIGGIVEIYFEPAIYDLEEKTYSIDGDEQRDTKDNASLIELTVQLNDVWYRSVTGSGEVTLLRIDSTNRIVSGTFSCEAVAIYPSNPNNRIKVTKGRFDININTLYKTLFP